MASMQIPCPECGSVLKLPDRSLLGKTGRCPSCRHKFVLVEPEEVELQLADGPVDTSPQQGTSARWVPDEPAAEPVAEPPESAPDAALAQTPVTPPVGAAGFPVFDDQAAPGRSRGKSRKKRAKKSAAPEGRRPKKSGPSPAVIVGSAIVVLAVQFDEIPAHFPQQADTGRLIVDEGFALPIRLDLATHDQRLTFLEFNVGIVQQLHQTARQAVELETGRNAGLVLSAPNQPAIRTIAQHQPQRVEQDRLARPGFARQHAQSPPEGQVERFDQHDIADG